MSQDREDRDDREIEEPHYEQEHRGTMILVLGILGLVVCQLVGIVAWFMAASDLKAMDEGRMNPEGREHTKVGKILGIVSACILAVQLVLFVVYIVFIVVLVGAGAIK